MAYVALGVAYVALREAYVALGVAYVALRVAYVALRVAYGQSLGPSMCRFVGATSIFRPATFFLLPPRNGSVWGPIVFVSATSKSFQPFPRLVPGAVHPRVPVPLRTHVYARVRRPIGARPIRVELLIK